MSERKTIDSEKLISEIKSEIEKNHYVSDIPGFDYVMDWYEIKKFDSEYLHAAVRSLHQNWQIDPHLNISGGELKNKAKRLVCKLTKPISEYLSEQISRANLNASEALSMIEAYIIQHENDQKTIEILNNKINEMENRLNRLETKTDPIDSEKMMENKDS